MRCWPFWLKGLHAHGVQRRQSALAERCKIFGIGEDWMQGLVSGALKDGARSTAGKLPGSNTAFGQGYALERVLCAAGSVSAFPT